MTVSVNSLNAALIYEYLDKSEGGKNVGDNRLGAEAWNKFIDNTGIKGSKISYSIFKDRTEKSYGAVVSLSSYLKKADASTKQKIADYLNDLEKNFDESDSSTQTIRNDVKTNTKSEPQQTSAKNPIRQTPKLVETSKKPVDKTDNPKIQNNVADDFSEHTRSLNSLNIEHATALLNVAQDSLGIREVSRREFEQLSDEEKARTQYAMIGSYGDITDQWCAHTVSTLCEKAGVPIGSHKSTVQGFINWAKNKGTYHSVISNSMNSANIYSERKSRSSQLDQQLQSIHEGDFIIMKNQYIARTSNAGDVSQKASHIMIVESVDTKNGKITVIEGNANENIYIDSERVLVKNSSEGRNGSQVVGEFQEVNKRDGLIRKEYTIEELVANGYSGYIDNSSIV